MPYTDETLEHLGKDGVKDIAIVAPGFTADCLETIDELGTEGREEFCEAGGEKYALIPCVNDHEVWLDAMHDIIVEELGSWLNGEGRSVNDCSVTCPTFG
jgi:ferrochelatase